QREIRRMRGEENGEGNRSQDHCATHDAPSTRMNSFVPGRPVNRSATGPPSRGIRTSMSKNGQHKRSCAAHSMTMASVFASDDDRDEHYENGSFHFDFPFAFSPAGRWNDVVHAEVFDELAVVIE